MARVKYICRVCKSDDVGRDAWTQWDMESQQWQIQNLMSESFCFKCDGETILDQVRDPQEEEDERVKELLRILMKAVRQMEREEKNNA
jgi:hypothetical protein